MRTKAFIKSRDQRKRVEMRFAHLKIYHGFERMRLRGLSGAAMSSFSLLPCRTPRPWHFEPSVLYQPGVMHQLPEIPRSPATTTDAGLKVRAELDENKYPKGVKISTLSSLRSHLTDPFHGDWNYAISPNTNATRRPP